MPTVRPLFRLLTIAAALVCWPVPLLAVEKASEQVSPFMGSFSYSVPIEAPGFHGLEPRLGLAYTSEGRNGPSWSY